VISVDPVVLGSVLERLRADHGFTADIGHLTVFGRCDQCEETS
jgi:Fur family ferric uptake transcriptional regulator